MAVDIYLLDTSGIRFSSRYDVNNIKSDSDVISQCFSPDGTKLVAVSASTNIYVFDFDRCTGSINLRETIPEPSYFGIAISPNSRFLYCNGYQGILVQYDLDAPVIANTIIGVAQDSSVERYGLNMLQLGNDGKVYVSSGRTDFAIPNYLHRFNNPDEPGLASNFQLEALHTATSYAYGLPTYPNYRLGALPGCVTTGINSPENIEPISIFPNPIQNELHINMPTPQESINIYNALGQQIYSQKLSNQTEFNINTQHWASGVYMATFKSKNGKISSYKIVKQ